jgi:hypothetical protein
MPNNTNNLTVDNYDPGVNISLGNGAHDLVLDWSAGGNTIAVGQGDNSVVADINGNYDIATLGNGAADIGVIYAATGVTMTLGNGDGDIGVDYSHGGNTFILGNGAGDIVYAPVGPDSSGETITVGNGANDTVVELDSFASTIHLGHGWGDTVWLATGRAGPGSYDAAVSFAARGATLDLFDAGGTSFASPTLASQASVSTAALDVIKGMVAGDSIILPTGAGNTDTLAAAANLAGVANQAVFATGTYNATAHTFTENATGHDALLTVDTQGAYSESGFLSVVLVGAAAEIAGSTIHSGTITLG